MPSLPVVARTTLLLTDSKVVMTWWPAPVRNLDDKA
jgi:hypothetical protein